MWDWLLTMFLRLAHVCWQGFETFYPNESGWYGWAWLKLAFWVFLGISFLLYIFLW